MYDRHCAYCYRLAVFLVEARDRLGTRAVQTCEKCRARGERWAETAGTPTVTRLEGADDLFSCQE